MRHLRSLSYALVLAPATWTLSAVAFTQELTGRARTEGSIEVFTGFLLLLLAGAAYAILLLPRFSPVGPVTTGVLFLAGCVWVLVDTASFDSMFPAGVRKPGFDLTLPAHGLAALLAVPLLCTALSRRRWRESRFDPADAHTSTIVWPFARPARPGTLVVPGVTGVPTSDATQVLHLGKPADATPPGSADRTQVVAGSADRTQVVGDTTRPVPPPGDATQVIPPAAEATQGLPPPAEATQVLPPPAEATQVLPPTGDATQTLPPPGDATQALPPTGDATQVLPTGSGATQVLPTGSGATDVDPTGAGAGGSGAVIAAEAGPGGPLPADGAGADAPGGPETPQQPETREATPPVRQSATVAGAERPTDEAADDTTRPSSPSAPRQETSGDAEVARKP